jgi:hypothetical protein
VCLTIARALRCVVLHTVRLAKLIRSCWDTVPSKRPAFVDMLSSNVFYKARPLLRRAFRIPRALSLSNSLPLLFCVCLTIDGAVLLQVTLEATLRDKRACALWAQYFLTRETVTWNEFQQAFTDFFNIKVCPLSLLPSMSASCHHLGLRVCVCVCVCAGC